MVQVHLGAHMKKTINTITVTAKTAGQRLDIFLAEKLKISRSQVQKLITGQQIFINENQPEKFGQKLRLKDKIEIRAIATKKENVKTDKKTTSKKLLPLKILAATEEYFVVDKPTGLLTHPTEAQEPNAVSEILLQKYPEIKKVGEDPMRPGIVHRLDKDASGLLVVARTNASFDNLKKQFKKHAIEKEYLVLVHGRVARDVGEINFPIARSQTSERMAAVPLSQQNETDAKHALTEFYVEKRFVNFSLLRIKIHTGRMHQIRAHMLAYGHPVVGDPLYIAKKQKRAWDKKCDRLFLHCTKLGFVDLSGIPQEFASPLPSELEKFLGEIK